MKSITGSATVFLIALLVACADDNDKGSPSAVVAGSGGTGGVVGSSGSGGTASSGAAGSAEGGAGTGGSPVSAGNAGNAGQAGGGEAGQGGSGGCTPEDQVQLSGTVYSNENGAPIEGSTVTILEGAEPKEIPTDKGAYQFLGCPQSTIFFRAEATGYAPMLRGIVMPEAGAIRDWYLPAQATIDGALQLTGETQDAAKGMLWLSFESATVAGYSAKLSSEHGATITLDPNGNLPAKAAATLSGGLDYWFLVFTNVTAGTTKIDLVTPDGHTCKPRTTVTDWRIAPQVITYVDVDCD